MWSAWIILWPPSEIICVCVNSRREAGIFFTPLWKILLGQFIFFNHLLRWSFYVSNVFWQLYSQIVTPPGPSLRVPVGHWHPGPLLSVPPSICAGLDIFQFIVKYLLIHFQFLEWANPSSLYKRRKICCLI